MPMSFFLAVACVMACVSCTYTIRFGQKPKFRPVRVNGVTFAPSVQADPPVVKLVITRPNPVTNQINTIQLADITVAVSGGAGQEVPLEVQQEGGSEVLLENGDERLESEVFAPLPQGVRAESVRLITVTYAGQSETSLLTPVR
jgi:hypothetical protein